MPCARPLPILARPLLASMRTCPYCAAPVVRRAAVRPVGHLAVSRSFHVLGISMRASLFCAIALALSGGYAMAAGTFTDVGLPGAQLTGLSHNGRVAAGSAGAAGWRWNKARGVVLLDGFTSANGMNSWGQPVAGSTVDGDGNTIAALAFSNFDVAGGPVPVGGYPGGAPQDAFLSSAYDASDDGVVVGLALDDASRYFAFRWTAAEGMTQLTVNRPANASRANAVSADGSTIIGWNDQDSGFRSGVIWQNGVPLDLADADGNPVGEALAVSSDGSVVVGTGYSNPDTGGIEAWRWTAATGVQGIGCIDDFGCGPAYGFALSDDGNVVVGASGFGFDRLATIWTPAGGMQLLSDYAAAQGVSIPAGWTLSSAGGVSADGKTIGGWGLGPVSMGSWVIDLHDAPPTEAVLEARGTVNWNDLPSGPFAGVPVGTEVTMTFRMTTDGAVELEPGEDTRYAIELDTFQLTAGDGSDVLVATEFGPGVQIANDYPLSDGIHLLDSPMATPDQMMEFELFNPGGDMFDSDDLDRINRTFGPEFFEKISWIVGQGGGSFGMYMDLQSVSIYDYAGEPVTYTIGGTVAGLQGSGLVLQQSGGGDLAIGADGAFAFATAIADGSAYSVTVLNQPTAPAQTCTVEAGSGTVAGADVADVAVTCVTDVSDVIFTDGFDGT
jgi:uncharacterized membrane protein